MSGSADEPEVSIVIPCFNRERWIGEAIESALAQGANVEVIVVDDGSTDGTSAVVSSYSDIRAVRIPNAGPSAARNEGVRHSRGRHLRFLDSDDRLTAGSTTMLLEASRPLPAGGIAFGDAQLIDQNGLPADGMTYGFADAAEGLISTATLLSRPMPAWSPLYPRSAIVTAGGFDERLRIGEDHELAVRIALQGHRFYRLPRVTYEVREHQGVRLSRQYGQEGYRALLDTFETIWAALEKRVEPLAPDECEAIGKYVWGLGRAAARERFKPECARLFSLAQLMAGPTAYNGPVAIRLAYRVMPPYWLERLAEVIKSAIGRHRAETG